VGGREGWAEDWGSVGWAAACVEGEAVAAALVCCVLCARGFDILLVKGCCCVLPPATFLHVGLSLFGFEMRAVVSLYGLVSLDGVVCGPEPVPGRTFIGSHAFAAPHTRCSQPLPLPQVLYPFLERPFALYFDDDESLQECSSAVLIAVTCCQAAAAAAAAAAGCCCCYSRYCVPSSPPKPHNQKQCQLIFISTAKTQITLPLLH